MFTVFHLSLRASCQFPDPSRCFFSLQLPMYFSYRKAFCRGLTISTTRSNFLQFALYPAIASTKTGAIATLSLFFFSLDSLHRFTCFSLCTEQRQWQHSNFHQYSMSISHHRFSAHLVKNRIAAPLLQQLPDGEEITLESCSIHIHISLTFSISFHSYYPRIHFYHRHCIILYNTCIHYL